MARVRWRCCFYYFLIVISIQNGIVLLNLDKLVYNLSLNKYIYSALYYGRDVNEMQFIRIEKVFVGLAHGDPMVLRM